MAIIRGVAFYLFIWPKMTKSNEPKYRILLAQYFYRFRFEYCQAFVFKVKFNFQFAMEDLPEFFIFHLSSKLLQLIPLLAWILYLNSL